jgi:hypothetical protein
LDIDIFEDFCFINIGDRKRVLRHMRGEEDAITRPSRLMSSNLKRAFQTILISLKNRKSATGEKIHIVSALQEDSLRLGQLH